MLKSLLVLCLLSTSAFAQSQLDQSIRNKAARLKDLIDNNIGRVDNRVKIEVNQTLSTALNELNTLMRDLPGPGPTPPPPPPPQAASLHCNWFDGQSHAIAQRGWHLVEQVRNITISRGFFGNNSYESSSNCMNTLISQTVNRGEIEVAKRRTCTCNWYPADVHYTPKQRGWHMTYTLNVMNGPHQQEVVVSAKFYGNNSTASQQACNSDMVRSNFSCNP